MAKLFLNSFFMFLLGLLCSCTETIEPKLLLNESPPIAPYPLQIGFHHSDNYKEYRSKEVGGTFIHFVFTLANPSALFFESNLKTMFKQVECIKDFSKALPENLDGIITAEIYSFTSPWDYRYQDPSFVNRADIGYIFSLYDNQFKSLGTLKITGKSVSDIGTGYNPTFFEDTVELAIKDAMAQFMLGFEKHPPFRRWLIQHNAIPNEKADTINEQ